MAGTSELTAKSCSNIDKKPKFTRLDDLLTTMADHKLSFPKACKLHNISRSAGYMMLARHGLKIADLQDRSEWTNDKAGRLESLQHKISRSISEAALEKDGARNHVVSMGILQDKIADLRGQARQSGGIQINVQIVQSGQNDRNDAESPVINVTPVTTPDE